MIPEKIMSYFQEISSENDGDNTLTEGIITCCGSHKFEVRIVGNVRSSLFSGQYLQAEDDELAMELCCKNCGKVFSGFDSNCDGYDRCGEKRTTKILPRRFACKKCNDSNFSVRIKYEYPDIEELDNLEMAEKDNAFTWIQVALKCNSCGTKYNKFIDYETA